MKKIITLTLAIASLTTTAFAQTFNYQAQVEKPKKDGYHEVLIPPEVTSRMTRNLADIRIYNAEQREIPYILKKETHATRQTAFKAYEIYDRDYHKGWAYESRYYIKNNEGTKIDHIVLKIRNFSDNKRVRLSGSDNGSQWFTIKDGYSFYEIISHTESYQYKVLHFPLSSYKYYKIEVDDHWHRDPINIMEAGYFTDDLEHGSYQKAEGAVMTQNEDREKKISRVKVRFPQSQWVDKLRFNINGDENFHRKARLMAKYYNEDSTFYYDEVEQFWLSSTQLNELRFNKLYARELELVIENKDNYPVKIESADAYQLKNYLVCELKKSDKYFVQYGDRKAKKPEYDIVYFMDEVPDNLRELDIFNAQRLDVFREVDGDPVVTDGPYLQEDPVEAPKEQEAEPEEDKAFYEHSSFIWIAVGLIVVLLGFMSIKMMGEVKGKENEKESENEE